MPPGWYAKEGDVDTVTFWDGFEWTDKVAPTRVTHDVKSLAQGVALGVVLGTFINGLLFWLVYFLVR